LRGVLLFSPNRLATRIVRWSLLAQSKSYQISAAVKAMRDSPASATVQLQACKDIYNLTNGDPDAQVLHLFVFIYIVRFGSRPYRQRIVQFFTLFL
jgi:hypothetical protein